MAMIFPGMDPYLEHPQVWPGVHHFLVVYLCHQLQPLLRPDYVAAIEERVFIETPDRQAIPDVQVRREKQIRREKKSPLRGGGPATAIAEVDEPLVLEAPGLEIHQPYLEILHRRSGSRVVAVIEVVSPSNKYAGPGQDSYALKQSEVLHSTAHLVEIDLLRTGPHVLAVPEYISRGNCDYDYLVCVTRAKGLRNHFELYPRRLRQRLPRIRVPLADDHPDVRLDIQAALESAYESGAYLDSIDYHEPCQPPLGADDQAWADQLIREKLPSGQTQA
jgi:hypothetical protein